MTPVLVKNIVVNLIAAFEAVIVVPYVCVKAVVVFLKTVNVVEGRFLVEEIGFKAVEIGSSTNAPLSRVAW